MADRDQIERMQEMLSTALGAGDGVVVVVVKGGGLEPTGLDMKATSMTPGVLVEVTKFMLEVSVNHCGRFSTGFEHLFVPHLKDALLSLDAAEVSLTNVVATAIGHA